MRVSLSKHAKLLLSVVPASFAVMYGLAAPAHAEGDFTSWMVGWNEGHESRQWIDHNYDATYGYAQFTNCSKLDFRITIYKEDFGPDTSVGTEVMQCKTGTGQTQDRVYDGDVGSDEYHFTLKTQISGGVDVQTVYVLW